MSSDRLPNWQVYADFAGRLADASGAVIRQYFRKPLAITDKSGTSAGFDPVTAADQEAEAAIRDLIRHAYPGHGILGEEHGTEAGGDSLTWVIDPIDGTRAFMTGMLSWGTLIALNDGAGPIVGVMDQPVTGERLTGTPEGAFLNGAPIRTRACAGLADAILYSTVPEMFSEPRWKAGFEAVEAKVRMRRFGGDCYAYCLLAMGFIDIVIEAGLKPYDIQALIPIIEGAGGTVTTWTGAPADQGGLIVAAGDKRVHDAALAILRDYAD
jgi:histidinol phosphatase-like enzyme (inositol monophosphatase family)